MRRLLTVALFVLETTTGGCLRPAHTPAHAPLPTAATLARGAATYGSYCAGCHGPNGRGDGPFATAYGLAPADLRAPALRSVSDAALMDRLMRGTPLAVPPLDARLAETRAVDALLAYLPKLASADRETLRVGRLVYEDACGPCHGVFGRADTAVAYWVGAPDLIVARERFTDAALMRISTAGVGLMPPLYGAFDRTELRALVGYIRHLSDGLAVYDTRCAACHGEDGLGLYSRDVVPPATVAPPLGGPYARDRLLTMLRREHGVMPHFADLPEHRLRDVIAYLRAGVMRPPFIVDARERE